MSATDRIQKQILLKAPLERVWRAISEAQRFGAWFGVRLEGEFAVGARMQGHIVATTVDPAVAKEQEPYVGLPYEILVESIEPMRRFAFRWHPNAVGPSTDYSNEPMTLVEFVLEEVPGGTRLMITESGFDQIPLARRAAALKSNDYGWAAQATLIEKYLAQTG